MSIPDSLPDRIKILRNTPLYEGGDFLIDIGCAWGYFEVELSELYKKIIAIAPGEDEIELAKALTVHLNNVSIYCSSFRNFNTEGMRADMVWMGNCFHYIFIEYNGFAFIPRLFELTSKYLIIEYPYDLYLDSSDMHVLLPRLQSLGLDKLFTKENILKQLMPYFTLEQTLKSGSPTREIIVLHKRSDYEYME